MSVFNFAYISFVEKRSTSCLQQLFFRNYFA